MKETPQINQEREYVTARQLAEILQVAQSTVRRLARDGTIPSVRLTPRLIRFHLRSVRDALKRVQRSQTPHTEPDTVSDSQQLSFDDLMF
jgi:excisionase family DNA binding protein